MQRRTTVVYLSWSGASPTLPDDPTQDWIVVTPAEAESQDSTIPGAALRAARNASGSHVVFWQEGASLQGAAEVVRQLASYPFAVPVFADSSNPDQRPSGGVFPWITTRWIDERVFALSREVLDGSRGWNEAFRRHGFALDLQARLALLGIKVTVVPTAPIASEPSPSEDEPEDWQRTCLALGAPMDFNGRPIRPRILPPSDPKAKPIEVNSENVLRYVNEAPAELYRIRDRVFQRILTGDGYALPPLMDSYSFAMHPRAGLGDALMVTSGLAVFNAAFPRVRIRAYARGGAAEVLERCPAVSEVVRYSRPEELPSEALHWNLMAMPVGSSHFAYAILGLSAYRGPKRMVFRPRPLDLPQVPGGTIGIQVRGGASSKYYSKWPELVRAIRESGRKALVFPMGYDGPPPEGLEDCFLTAETPTVDHLAHYVKGLSGWIGFDSGPSFMANALGIPTVWLCATHDPGTLIGGCGDAAPWTAIWRKWQARCAETHGITCRKGFGVPTGPWGACAIREGRGADCIDDISVEEILRALDSLTARK